MSKDKDRAKEEKLRYLVAEYGNLMYFVAHNVLNDYSLAEEAVHDGFIKLLPYVDDLNINERTKTKNFLCLIVKHRAINMFNARKKQVNIDYFELMDTPDMDIARGDPMELMISRESYNELAEMIRDLPYIYSEIILLIHVFQFSHKDCSIFLGISEIAVRKRKARAKKLLREKMQSKGDQNERSFKA